jgi:sulfite exporter TauE/SafE
MGSYLAIGALLATDGAPAASASGVNEFFFAGVAGIAVGAGLMIGGFSLAAANRATPTAVDRTPPALPKRDPTGRGLSLSGTF